MGISPPHGSHAAVPIAMSVAGRKYHYHPCLSWRMPSTSRHLKPDLIALALSLAVCLYISATGSLGGSVYVACLIASNGDIDISLSVYFPYGYVVHQLNTLSICLLHAFPYKKYLRFLLCQCHGHLL